jgi:hypothetical protein
MERHDEPSHQEVINQAIHCAVAYDTGGQVGLSREPTRVVDMATTGGILEGYTHMIFVAFGKTGYVVSRNLKGQYKVEICDQITC